MNGAVSSVQVQQGANTDTNYYEGTVTVGGSGTGAPVITSSEGNDTIAQFQSAGPNVDTIELRGLAGITAVEFDLLFNLNTDDVDGDGNQDSVLSWDGGSITILGSTWGDIGDFYNDSRVDLT